MFPFMKTAHAQPCFVQTPFIATHKYSPSLQSGLDHVCARRAIVPARRLKRANTVSMGLFGLGFPELAVIAGIGIFVFGPNKVAELGKDLGGLAGGLKKASSEFKDAMQESLDEADRDIEQKSVEQKSASTVETTARPANPPTTTNTQEKAET